MIKMTTNTKEHLGIIEGETKQERTRRLTKIRQQKFRAAKKLSDPTFIQKQSAIRQTARLAKKVVIKPVVVEQNDSCDQLVNLILEKEQKVKEKNPSYIIPKIETVKSNVKKVNIIYEKFAGEPNENCLELNWVRATDAVSEFIAGNKTWSTDQSKNSYRSALASVLRNFDEYKTEYNFYSELSSKVATEIKTEIGKNKLSPKLLKNYLKWDTIIEKTEEALVAKDIPLKDKVLMALYTLMPPRRGDFKDMKIIRTKSKKINKKYIEDLSKEFNYLILDKRDRPKQFIYHRYKTDRTYGSQTFDIADKKLRDLLTQYIRDYKILNADYLLTNSKGAPYEKTFSNYIASVFKQATGKTISIDILRHSYITDFLSNKPTLNKRAHIAKEMANSISTQAEYEFINAT